eukprot:NODE_41_length_34096_cov_2.002235.p29 type:complete len:121 gc:universal NODE_41_length_34096_cov_2.002235:28330-28692(+)
MLVPHKNQFWFSLGILLLAFTTNKLVLKIGKLIYQADIHLRLTLAYEILSTESLRQKLNLVIKLNDFSIELSKHYTSLIGMTNLIDLHNESLKKISSGIRTLRTMSIIRKKLPKIKRMKE